MAVKSPALLAALAFFAFAVAITVRIIQTPGISKFRRILGIVVDNTAASFGVFVLGEAGAVIVGLYLFVTLGNGFRYGRFYLHTSQILSLLGFGTVMYASAFWFQHKAIGAGFLIALVIVPFYVGILAERIEVARRRADNANQAKGRFLATVSH